MRPGLAALALSCAPLCIVGCDDVQQPSLPADGPESASLHVISCRADIDASMVECARPALERSSLRPEFDIVGGQGVYVLLSSSNVNYDASAEVFSADVTVQNLMSRRLGTPDGNTVTGVRVFFHSGPQVTSGSGTVAVRNPDGISTFTGASQPYFEYAEMLNTNATTVPKTWEWDVPSSVLTFAFEVYVEADRTGNPAGWWIGSADHSELGWTLGVDAAGTPVTQITHYLGGTDDGLQDLWFNCSGDKYRGFASRTNGGAGWPIHSDQFDTGLVTVAGGVGYSYILDMDLEGEFQSQSLTGSWHAISSVVNRIPVNFFCSGSWTGEPATKLFLRYDGTVPFLAEAPSPAGESWWASFADGETLAWIAELGAPLVGDLYAFELWLRAASGSGGGFDMWLIADHGATQTTLAQTVVAVPRRDTFRRFVWMAWWAEEGGGVGDDVILRMEYWGSEPGELLFGYGQESYAIVPGRVDVSRTASPTATIATGSVRIESSSHGARMIFEPRQR